VCETMRPAFRADSCLSTMSADSEPYLQSLVSQRLLDDGHVVSLSHEDDDPDAIPDETPVMTPPCSATVPTVSVGQRKEREAPEVDQRQDREAPDVGQVEGSEADAQQRAAEEVPVGPKDPEPIPVEIPVAAAEEETPPKEPSPETSEAAQALQAAAKAREAARSRAKARNARAKAKPAQGVGAFFGAVDAAGRDFFKRISQDANQAAERISQDAERGFLRFEQMLAPVFEAVEKGVGVDGESEEESEYEEEEESPTANQAPQPAPQMFQAASQAAPSQAAPFAPAEASLPAPAGYPPLVHPAFKGMHEAASAPLLGFARDLAAIYRRFHDANELHMRTHKRRSPEANYGMAGCLSLGALRVLTSNGDVVVPGLPPLQNPGAAGPAGMQLFETRLDLAVVYLSRAVEAGYNAFQSMMADVDMQALREHRQPQFALAVQRAQANAAAAMNAATSQGAAMAPTRAVSGSALQISAAGAPVSAPRGTSWHSGTPGTASTMFLQQSPSRSGLGVSTPASAAAVPAMTAANAVMIASPARV